MGGMAEGWEDRSPSNSVGGVDEAKSDNQEEEDEIESDNQEEESGEDAVSTNPAEGIEDLGAPSVEVEARAALDAVTVEVEAVGSMMKE